MALLFEKLDQRATDVINGLRANTTCCTKTTKLLQFGCGLDPNSQCGNLWGIGRWNCIDLLLREIPRTSYPACHRYGAALFRASDPLETSGLAAHSRCRSRSAIASTALL